MSTLTPLQRAFVNRFQGGFPLTGRPYLRVAAKLGTDETTLISLITQLLEDGRLSRFGPLFDAERLGGRFTLAALAVGEQDFERAATAVNALPQVAHNYRRDHALNMWLVLAVASEPELRETIAHIQELAGARLYDFPKLREFHLGFWLEIDVAGNPALRPVHRPHRTEKPRVDALDRDIVAATQAGLPLVSAPYAAVAEEIGSDEDTVLQRLDAMLRTGAVRRIGAVPNHYRLGLRGNGMSVWDIDDDKAKDLGERIGGLEFVSHCYLRPRRAPIWPYNLFAMVHGRNRAEVDAQVARIAALAGNDCRDHDVLLSTAILKKTGLRLGG